MPSLPEPVWRRRLQREHEIMSESRASFTCNADRTEYTITLHAPGLVLEESGAVRMQDAHRVRIRLGREYPYAGGLEVTWLTPIFHPNIRQEDGKVCIQLLNAWSADVTVANIVEGLAHLLEKPNPSDPLNKPAADYFMAHPNALNRSHLPAAHIVKRPRIVF